MSTKLEPGGGARVVSGLQCACLSPQRSLSSLHIHTPPRAAPQNLESTVVSDNQLVNISLALLYGVFTIVAVFAPRIVSVIGAK
jgi:hypothetical protein